MKLSTNAIKTELEKMGKRGKEIKQKIEMLQYEYDSLERAAGPLKQAYDELVKITGKDEKREVTVKPRNFKIHNLKCVDCGAGFQAKMPMAKRCANCKALR